MIIILLLFCATAAFGVFVGRMFCPEGARWRIRMAELERCARYAEKTGEDADAAKDSAKDETARALAVGASVAAWSIAAKIRSEK